MDNTDLLLNTTVLLNSSTVDSKPFSNRQVIGVGLALTGNFFISISLNVQKKAHNRYD